MKILKPIHISKRYYLVNVTPLQEVKFLLNIKYARRILKVVNKDISADKNNTNAKVIVFTEYEHLEYLKDWIKRSNGRTNNPQLLKFMALVTRECLLVENYRTMLLQKIHSQELHLVTICQELLDYPNFLNENLLTIMRFRNELFNK